MCDLNPPFAIAYALSTSRRTPSRIPREKKKSNARADSLSNAHTCIRTKNFQLNCPDELMSFIYYNMP